MIQITFYQRFSFSVETFGCYGVARIFENRDMFPGDLIQFHRSTCKGNVLRALKPVTKCHQSSAGPPSTGSSFICRCFIPGELTCRFCFVVSRDIKRTRAKLPDLHTLKTPISEDGLTANGVTYEKMSPINLPGSQSVYRRWVNAPCGNLLNSEMTKMLLHGGVPPR